MNKNTVKIILWAILVATACKPGRQTEEKSESILKETRIEGILDGGENYEVVLEEMAVREYIPIDTVRLEAEGRFQINFDPEQTAFYVLRIGGEGYVTLLIDPGQKITFKGTYGVIFQLPGFPGFLYDLANLI